MDCENIREMLAGYQDGELDTEQKALVEEHLNRCRTCREELAGLEKVKEVTRKVKYDDLPLEVWQGYWQNLYRRLERGVGWIFTSIGAIILLITGSFYLVKDYFLDATVPLLPKFGVGALIIGGIILLVSVARERLFAYNRERYREVQR
jgi:predicted anti-sigma-YlaC factor YlaD